jgi:riboflavin biosynthesis pyrimidine reductase
VHIEAGSGLNGALLQADCVDELLVYMAPMLLGEGLSMAQLPSLTKLEGVQRFEFTDVTTSVRMFDCVLGCLPLARADAKNTFDPTWLR